MKTYNKQPSIIGGIILWIILFVLMFSEHITGSLLKRKLEDNKNISIESLYINIFTGSLFGSNLKCELPGKSKNESYSCDISNVRITGISFWSLIRNKPFTVNGIEIYNPQINIRAASNNRNDSMQMDQSWIEKNISFVNKIKIFGGIVNFSVQGKDSMIVALDQIRINEIKPGNWQRNNPELIKSVELQINQCQYFLANRVYQFKCERINFKSDDNSLLVDSIKVIPLHSKAAFDDIIGDQTDRIEISLNKIEIDFNNWTEVLNNSIHAGKVAISEGTAHVYRDKRKTRLTGKLKKTLQEYLKLIKINFLVDTLTLNDVDLVYEEHNDKSIESGRVNFTNIFCKINNIASGDKAKSKLSINASARFMESGKLNADLIFPYGEQHFLCTGTLKNLPFRELNKISTHNGSIEFTSGKIDRMDFNFRGDADRSSGDLLILYNDLDFSVINAKKQDSKNIKSKIISFIASDILISSANPKKDKDPVKGVINWERDKEKFIFNYIFKSILSGITSTVIGSGNQEKLAEKLKRRKSKN